MIYEAYEKKIGRRARWLSPLVRRLPLIVAALALLLSAAAGYAALKGLVVHTSCAPRITYGEDAAYEAKALFGGVSYQHRAEDADEWTDGTPLAAGRFRVRAVARGIFGRLRYGEEVAIEILPKPIITESMAGWENTYASAS